MEREDIVSRLITELGYTTKEAELSARDLQSSAAPVQVAFNKWWEGRGLDPHLEVQGYTLEKLTNDYGFNPIAALLTMDRLIREPDEAIEALNEGYDVVHTSHVLTISQ